jgi:hypothetical protein
MKLPANKPAAKLLRRALLGNAAFSAICGVLIVTFDTQLVGLMTDLQHHLWPLGLMLLAFAASLLWFSTRPTISSAWVASVIIADLAWVAGTVALLLGAHGLLTVAGLWILAVVGVFVFGFAELQWLGLRRLRRTAT